METRWIQDFVTLTEVRNFTRAAELRNVSQAAFSRRIQALEQWLDTTLVDRTCYPLRITEAGERFRPAAMALLDQIADTKADVAGQQSGSRLKVALPFALAATRLAGWWRHWCPDPDVQLQVETGNVHDTLQALSEGRVDLVIAYTHASSPALADVSRHDVLRLGSERLQPYTAARDGQPLHAFPGTPAQPVPLLMYAPSVYFARVVDAVLDGTEARVHGFPTVESAMTDVLASMAQEGLGVAWLPDSSFVGGRYPGLVPLGGGRWSIDIDIAAYRVKANSRRVLERTWARLVSTPGDVGR